MVGAQGWAMAEAWDLGKGSVLGWRCRSLHSLPQGGPGSGWLPEASGFFGFGRRASLVVGREMLPHEMLVQY